MTAGQMRSLTLLVGANDEVGFVIADGTILNFRKCEIIKSDDGSRELLFRLASDEKKRGKANEFRRKETSHRFAPE